MSLCIVAEHFYSMQSVFDLLALCPGRAAQGDGAMAQRAGNDCAAVLHLLQPPKLFFHALTNSLQQYTDSKAPQSPSPITPPSFSALEAPVVTGDWH